MVLNWIIEGGFKKIPAIFHEKHRILTISFTVIYILYLVGMLYSRNMKYGFFDLQIKLSMLLFPLIFATIDKNFPIRKLITNVFKAFIAGCVTGTLILFIIAICSFLGSRNPQVFFYTTFSRFLHPSYLSMYLNLAVSILAYYVVRKEQPLTKKHCILFFVLAFYLSCVIILLSSKAGIVSLIFLYLLIALYLLVINKQVLKGLLFFILVLVIFFVGYNFIPIIAERFKKVESVLSEQKKPSPENMESNSERLVVWKAGIEVIRENLIFGVGTGDVKDVLLLEYKKRKMNWFTKCI